MKTHHLPSDDYEKLLTGIMLCRVDPYTREPDRSALIEVLGELGDIWPESSRPEDEECQ
jgi:hypothetical protein